MRAGKDELNLSIDTDGLKVSTAVFGDMVVAYLRRRAAIDMPQLAKGLTNDVCPCPHWGYVFDGSIIIRYKDGTEERVRAGDVFYCSPGHEYRYDEDASLIEFSPLAEMRPVAEAINRNLASARTVSD